MGAQIFRKCRNEPQIVMAIRVSCAEFDIATPKNIIRRHSRFCRPGPSAPWICALLA